MTPWRFMFFFLASLWLAPALVAAGEESDADFIDIEALAPGEVLFDYETGIGVITNAFIVRYRDAVLTADRGQFNERSGDLLVEGSVTLQRDTQIWRGERLLYNLYSRTLQSADFRTGRWPVFAAGQGLHLDLTNQIYTATNAYITSDDIAEPGFRIRARRLKIAPGRYFEVRHAVLYAGDIPVFYFPYLRRSLTARANQFYAVPGYRSRYGAYLLGAYEWYWTERLNGVLHLDYRVKRGIGGGLDFQYDAGRWGQSDFRGYLLHDIDAESVKGFDGQPAPVDPERHRISFTHQAVPATNLTFKLAVRDQSDPYVVRDFFESEYRDNPQPASFLEIDRLWPNFTLNLLVQPQLNPFFETVERLPDLKLTAPRTQLGPLPFFYEGESSVAYLQRRFPDPPGPNDYSAFRADSLHQLLLPQTLFGWLNVTPRVGGRVTYYGETDTEGPPLERQTRGVFHTGAEVSFKGSQLWPDTSSRFFQVDGLRHIFQPAVNYSYVPSPTARPPELPQFDTQWPSLQLLPHWFPDFNSVDAIDARNVMRLGLRNRLQTKRDGLVDNLLDWDLYADWLLDRPPGEHTFSDLFSDLDLKPWRWMTLTSQLRVDPEEPRVRIANHMLTLTPNSTWSWSFGHRYLREDPELGFSPGHDLLLNTLYYRINENWGLRLSHHYELSDHTLEEQYYTLYRDFRSWTGALTFRVRDNRDGDRDYSVAFTFQLKAFPRFKSGTDRNQPSLLLGL
jgi:LPS-assembly protein